MIRIFCALLLAAAATIDSAKIGAPLAFALNGNARSLSLAGRSKVPRARETRILSSSLDGNGNEIPSDLTAAAFERKDFAQNIKIYDGVFSPETCDELNELAWEHAERGHDGSSIYYRNKGDEADLTPLETALESYLQKIGDTNEVVEYWSRTEYINMDVHSDIDEVALEDGGVLRFPEWGHILYLTDLHDKKSKVTGYDDMQSFIDDADIDDDRLDDLLDADPSGGCPTCIFSKPGGWGWDYSPDDDDKPNVVEICIVPAVQGRVVRFPGSAMHSVPKPAYRYLLPRKTEKALRELEQIEEVDGEDWEDDLDEEDEEDDEDEDDDDFAEAERAVVLFNTWSERGPIGIGQDFALGIVPDGIEIFDEDEEEIEDEVDSLSLLVPEWKAKYGDDYSSLSCRDMSEWQPNSIVPVGTDRSLSEDSEGSMKKVRIPLMGDRERRQFPKKYPLLNTDSPTALTKSLTEPRQPSIVALSER